MALKIDENIDLKEHCTLKMGGNARYFTEINSEDELLEALIWTKVKEIRYFILGSGSNVVFTDSGFNGLVISMNISGFEIIEETSDYVDIKIGAGENWDKTVERTVEKELSGIEALSAIPGTVGAAPVQNIGAYGQEIKDTLVSVKVYDTAREKTLNLSNEQCLFDYRDSIFKKEPGKFIILEVILRLKKERMDPPFYASLQKYIEENKINDFTPKNIRNAVISIRKKKLPNPSEIANVGSFFKNPVIDRAHLDEISQEHPEIPSYPVSEDKVKVPAGWLIENAGLKGYCSNDLCTYDKNALVIINENNASYKQLKDFKEEIKSKILELFNIELEQEPQLVLP